MDISRLPGTGLIRGQIISAVTEVLRASIEWKADRMRRAGCVQRAAHWIQDVAFIHRHSPARPLAGPLIRKNCSLFNYEWKPTVARESSLGGHRRASLVRSISPRTCRSMRTYLDRLVCVCASVSSASPACTTLHAAADNGAILTPTRKRCTLGHSHVR